MDIEPLTDLCLFIIVDHNKLQSWMHPGKLMYLCGHLTKSSGDLPTSCGNLFSGQELLPLDPVVVPSQYLEATISSIARVSRQDERPTTQWFVKAEAINIIKLETERNM